MKKLYIYVKPVVICAIIGFVLYLSPVFVEEFLPYSRLESVLPQIVMSPFCSTFGLGNTEECGFTYLSWGWIIFPIIGAFVGLGIGVTANALKKQ